ncbi:uncharacterized protein LOC112082107 [Eutrema salsugineum]|uniref:uncharacterized protein LOC112082107 n=1 Tax=Eutrema salsugineum TaxID=72664 RepID=UPI000CED3226|nr:uncharacterized protein LOC112082107 [Eutrema salsugineum]
MNRYQFRSAEKKDAVQCQLFIESLAGIALDWFSRLDANSINNYKELTTAFVKHFSMFIRQNTNNSELWKIAQGANESLRDFIHHFKTIIAHCTISDEAVLLCLQKVARIKTSFRSVIKHNPPQTLEDALHRANTYIAEEKEETAHEQSYIAKQPERPKTDTYEPQSGHGREYENRKKFYANAIQQPTKQWKHQYRKGQISLEDLRCSTAHRSRSPRLTNTPPENTAAKDLPTLPPPLRNPSAQPEQQKRNRDEPAPENHTPKARKRVNMIMGAIETCSYSVRAIKEYSRQAATAPELSHDPPKGTPLIFTEADTIGLHKPHNNALVLELLLNDVEVSRILIDTGSSVNIIFKDAFDQLGILADKIERFIEPLTGFNSERCMTVGTVKIPIYLASVAKSSNSSSLTNRQSTTPSSVTLASCNESSHLHIPSVPQIPNSRRHIHPPRQPSCRPIVLHQRVQASIRKSNLRHQLAGHDRRPHCP